MSEEKYENLGYDVSLIQNHATEVGGRDWVAYTQYLESLKTPDIGRMTDEYTGRFLDHSWSLSIAKNGAFYKTQTSVSSSDRRIPKTVHQKLGYGNIFESPAKINVPTHRLIIGARAEIDDILTTYGGSFQIRKNQAQIMRDFINKDLSGFVAREKMSKANNSNFQDEFKFNPVTLAAFVDSLEAGFYLAPQPTSFENRNTPQYAFILNFGTEDVPIIDALVESFPGSTRRTVDFNTNKGKKRRHFFKSHHNNAYRLLKTIEPHVVFKKSEVTFAMDYLKTLAVFNMGMDNSKMYKQGGNTTVGQEYIDIREKRNDIRIKYLEIGKDMIVKTQFTNSDTEITTDE